MYFVGLLAPVRGVALGLFWFVLYAYTPSPSLPLFLRPFNQEGTPQVGNADVLMVFILLLFIFIFFSLPFILSNGQNRVHSEGSRPEKGTLHNDSDTFPTADPNLAAFPPGAPDFGYSTPHRLPDFDTPTR